MENLSEILIAAGIIALFFLEGLFEVTILSIPGAFIRWILGGKKKKFKEYYRKKAKLNTILGMITVVSVIIIVFFAVSILSG